MITEDIIERCIDKGFNGADIHWFCFKHQVFQLGVESRQEDLEQASIEIDRTPHYSTNPVNTRD